jgi:hypothetical protein
MATYCGTSDCILITRDWSDITLDGTTSYASDYITAASEWVDGVINDWHCPVSPLTSGGTVYDYWIKQAAANRACFIAYDSVMRDKYEVGEQPYWYAWKNESEEIMGSLRTAHSAMTEDTSEWERGIAPAQGVANGTVSAPYAGIMLSNHETGYYTADDNIPRTILVRLDGSGTQIDNQTFRFQFLGGTDWEATSQPITPNQWFSLAYGVGGCFPTQANAAVENGMTWHIQCYPSRGGNYKTGGLTSWDSRIG